MSAERLRMVVLFGGRSVEHEVSVVSAQGVLGAIDRDRFDPIPLGITRSGVWLTARESASFLGRLGPGHYTSLPAMEGDGLLGKLDAIAALRDADVVFPLVHGTHGEDGTLQGLLELAGVPYVGAGVLASALGMDKSLQKSLFRQAGLPVCDWVTVPNHLWEDEEQTWEREVEGRIGYPCFVKPANGGSSIGTSKVQSREDLSEAITEAFQYDSKVLVEQAIAGREIECSVLGNHKPEASPVGEIIPSREFYDYVAKYEDQNTQLVVPAQVSKEAEDKIRELAVVAFQAIDCAGMARVDFFLTPDTQVFVNEINTIPGFTPISMYPKLWEAVGLSYSDLIARLINLALERQRERRHV